MSWLNEIVHWWEIRSLKRRITIAEQEGRLYARNNLRMHLARLRGTTQTSWVWCPGCKEELTAGGAACWDDENGHTRYLCQCGLESRWDLATPAPLFLGSEPRMGGTA